MNNKISEIAVDSVFGSTHPALQEIGKLLQTRLSHYEIEKFAYVITDRNFLRPPFIISNYSKEWMRKYKFGRFILSDPVIQYALRNVSPFSWGPHRRTALTEKDGEIYHGAKRYNLFAGYAFVVHGIYDEAGILNIYEPAHFSKKDFENYIKQHAGELQMLLLDVHEIASEIYHVDDPRIQIIKKLNFNDKERRVIYWAAQGKTYSEIGMIMGFKERTIKKYMASVVSKLDVNNAKHAISKSVELKLVSAAP